MFSRDYKPLFICLEKNVHNEILEQLDPGGSFKCYLNAVQVL